MVFSVYRSLLLPSLGIFGEFFTLPFFHIFTPPRSFSPCILLNFLRNNVQWEAGSKGPRDRGVSAAARRRHRPVCAFMGPFEHPRLFSSFLRAFYHSPTPSSHPPPARALALDCKLALSFVFPESAFNEGGSPHMLAGLALRCIVGLPTRELASKCVPPSWLPPETQVCVFLIQTRFRPGSLNVSTEYFKLVRAKLAPPTEWKVSHVSHSVMITQIPQI